MIYFLIVTIIVTILTAVGLFLKNKIAPRVLLPISVILWLILFAWILLSHVIIFLIVLLYLVFVFLYGRHRYYKLQTKKLFYKSQKLKNKYQIVYLTDFQFDIRSDKINYRALNNVIKETNLITKDILLLGGDYLNYANNVEEILDYFAKFDIPKYGIYAVCGNHDYVAYNDVVEKLKAINIKVVENASDIISEDLRIVGVEDEWFGEPELPPLDNRFYNLLLSHNPDFILKVDEHNDVDLMLSGHYHKGQLNILIFPLQKLVSKYIYGKFFTKGINIFVSSGVGGTFMRGKSGIYARYFADPEIVIINLEGEDE